MLGALAPASAATTAASSSSAAVATAAVATAAVAVAATAAAAAAAGAPLTASRHSSMWRDGSAVHEKSARSSVAGKGTCSSSLCTLRRG